jgi:hypothetical protein
MPSRKAAAKQAKAPQVSKSVASKAASKSPAKKVLADKALAIKALANTSPAKSAGKSSVAAQTAAKRQAENDVSVAARQLAADLEKRLSAGQEDLMSEPALQVLMAALCKVYAVKIQDSPFLPLASTQSVTPTDVMLTTGALLKAADLQVFELGMWQSWTGR